MGKLCPKGCENVRDGDALVLTAQKDERMLRMEIVRQMKRCDCGVVDKLCRLDSLFKWPRNALPSPTLMAALLFLM